MGMTSDDPKAVKQFRAMLDTSVQMNSDLTYLVSRDEDEKPLIVGVIARGEYAPRLAAFLESLDLDQPKPKRKRKS